MKLRLNLGDHDLAYRFSVNQYTITRYLKRWIDVTYEIEASSEVARMETAIKNNASGLQKEVQYNHRLF